MAYDYRGTRDWIFGMSRDAATIKERALLLALNEFAPNIEPSTTRLADMLGTSEREVRRLLHSAKAKRLLTIELRTGQRSRYRLCVDPGGYVLPTPADMSSPEEVEPRTPCPPTPADMSSPPRRICPPKQTSEAVNEADKGSASHDAVTFALESPPKPRARKPRNEPTGYRQTVDCYFSEFRASRGCDPVFEDREGKWSKDLLRQLKGDADEACRRIRIAFASWRGKTITIRDIASNPDQFATAEAPRKANGRHAPQQTDSESVRAVLDAHQGNFS